MFSDTQLEVIKYCAQECYRQHSGEESVHDMVNAWNLAHGYHYGDLYWDPSDGPETETFAFINAEQERQNKIPLDMTLEFIERIGKLVEPYENKKGFRTIPIYVGNRFDMVEKAPWDRVIPLLNLLLESYYDGSLQATHKFAETREDQFYYEYENIHPFVDGNGRSGKILYNYLNDTLDAPIMPPNFWGSSNP